MYLKYQENIHIIENYQSIVKGDSQELRLINESHSIILIFKNSETRNWVLSHIWLELASKTEFVDLDHEIEVYYTSKKYKCDL